MYYIVMLNFILNVKTKKKLSTILTLYRLILNKLEDTPGKRIARNYVSLK